MAVAAVRRRRALLAWFRRHARDLPWRRTRDPYAIWVSEVMLQQTQVATATPYYERFLARFPDVQALADAPLDAVLAAWAGLGYYRRARFLHAGAQSVVRDHAGRVPSEPAAFGALPGVGRYTMGAVLSMGFGLPLPVLDGNVARVFSRWLAEPLAVRRPADARRLWDHATAAMPGGRHPAAPHPDAGDWNQALMELGATVCTPRAPACPRCPVRRWCAADAAGRVAEFPPVAARRAPETVRRALVLVRDRGARVLLVRHEGALLTGLWEPPGADVPPAADPRPALRAALAAAGIRRSRLKDTGVRVPHTITHRRLVVEVWTAALTGPAPRASARRAWARPGTRDRAWTALARKVVAAAGG
jgi:A/G-specific adenine glycosylase